MSIIDIRTTNEESIDTIIYIDNFSVVKNGVYSHNKPEIYCESEGYGIPLCDKESVVNLIKSLQKALELGWWHE